MSRSDSRFEAVSRRTFMRRTLATGAVVLVPVLAACGTSDEEAFAEDTSSGATPDTTAASAGAAETTTTAVAATDAAVVETTPAAGGGAASGGTALADTAELSIDFTFAVADSGRRVQNPYIAVWIENEAEELVQTVALWFNPPKGFKWLPDLKRWYSADQTRIDAGGEDVAETISAATRVAGDYSLLWDGTDMSGARVAQGSYFVCIEGAREHGPYELIRSAVTLGSEGFTSELEPDGELTAASVTFRV